MPEVDRKLDTPGTTVGKPNTSKVGAQPVADNPQQRLKWIAHLEFAQTVRPEKGMY